LLRTPRGRVLAELGWRHLGLMPPSGAQTDLLEKLDDPDA
jgi:Holliday junction DNA helicase RuvB